jgi:hypothetical protein
MYPLIIFKMAHIQGVKAPDKGTGPLSSAEVSMSFTWRFT